MMDDPNIDQVRAAFMAAHEAGDKPRAQILADYIAAQQNSQDQPSVMDRPADPSAWDTVKQAAKVGVDQLFQGFGQDHVRDQQLNLHAADQSFGGMTDERVKPSDATLYERNLQNQIQASRDDPSQKTVLGGLTSAVVRTLPQAVIAGSTANSGATIKAGVPIASKLLGGAVKSVPRAAELAAQPLAKGLGTSVGLGLGTGYLEPRLDGESRPFNMLTSTVGSLLGYGATQGMELGLSTALNSKAKEQIANSSRDAAYWMARKFGFAIPPSQSNPTSLLARSMDVAGGGHPRMGQAASLVNRKPIQELAAQSIGVNPEMTLTRDVTRAVRAREFERGYRPVMTNQPMVHSPEFRTTLSALKGDAQSALDTYGSVADNGVSRFVNQVGSTMDTTPKAALALTQIQRQLANKDFHAGDTAMYNARKSVAKAAEEDVDQFLRGGFWRRIGRGALGMDNGLDAYRRSREIMARSHAIDDSLSHGAVSAGSLGSKLDAGERLTSGLHVIGRVGQKFPKAVADLPSNVPLASQFDLVTAGTAAYLTQNPLWLGVGLLRNGIRNFNLSNTGQRLLGTPSYTVPLMQRAAGSLPSRALVQGLSTKALMPLGRDGSWMLNGELDQTPPVLPNTFSPYDEENY